MLRRPDYIKGPYWEPRDIWLGVYWDRSWITPRFGEHPFRRLDVYVCLIPCWPVRLIWTEHRQQGEQEADRES